MTASKAELAELKGLGSAKRLLNRLFEAESGVHAVLFYGPRGSGKTALANLLARAWMCPQAGSEGACGDCPVCRSFAEGRSADLQVIEPWGAGRQIKVSALIHRETEKQWQGVPLTTYFRTKPLMARSKVVIIEDADRMNDAATSKLLKTLEEPQERRKLILTTRRLARLKPTIRSRCICIGCEAPNRSELGEEPAIQAFARTMGDADEIRQSPEVYARIQSATQSLATGSPARAMRLSQELQEIAKELKEAHDLEAREAQVMLLELMGRALEPGGHLSRDLAESARLINGYVNAGAVFDSLCARTMAART